MKTAAVRCHGDLADSPALEEMTLEISVLLSTYLSKQPYFMAAIPLINWGIEIAIVQ